MKVWRGRPEDLKISGDNYGEDPPVSMPNTVVKLPDADDSALEAARENMSLPGLKKTDTDEVSVFLCFDTFDIREIK